ncbi:MAG: hypothetical protein IJF17_03250 [Thermoguttaceae bacterium]|nr:hypothetical protein [Thermoguttaceae bacterium]
MVFENDANAGPRGVFVPMISGRMTEVSAGAASSSDIGVRANMEARKIKTGKRI